MMNRTFFIGQRQAKARQPHLSLPKINYHIYPSSSLPILPSSRKILQIDDDLLLIECPCNRSQDSHNKEKLKDCQGWMRISIPPWRRGKRENSKHKKMKNVEKNRIASPPHQELCYWTILAVLRNLTVAHRATVAYAHLSRPLSQAKARRSETIDHSADSYGKNIVGC